MIEMVLCALLHCSGPISIQRLQHPFLPYQERPLEDYFNEWFIPLFLLAAFSAQKRYQTIHGSFQWFIWNFLVFFSWFVSLNCAVWILPAMSPGTWGVKERRSNRAKAQLSCRSFGTIRYIFHDCFSVLLIPKKLCCEGFSILAYKRS